MAIDPAIPKESILETHPWPDSWDITRFAIYKAAKGKPITLLESYLDSLMRKKYDLD